MVAQPTFGMHPLAPPGPAEPPGPTRNYTGGTFWSSCATRTTRNHAASTTRPGVTGRSAWEWRLRHRRDQRLPSVAHGVPSALKHGGGAG